MTWTALWTQSYFLSSFLCSVVLVVTFLKNNMHCFSIIKVTFSISKSKDQYREENKEHS